MLSTTFAVQRFQSIPGRHPQIIEAKSVVEETQFAQCHDLNIAR
jgi:hypothetical protein